MASPNIYQSTGGSSGSRLSTRSPHATSGKRWFIGSSGVDAASPRGLDRLRPLATFDQALINAAAGDSIVFLENYALSPTTTYIVNKAGLWIEGEGSGGSRPRITCAGAVITFDITAAGVTIENIYFPTPTVAPTARVRIATAGCEIRDCVFESGTLDTNPAVDFVTGAGQCLVKSTTFQSTSTAVATQPAMGLRVANAMSDLDLESVTFDGGTVGWSDYAFKGVGAITRLAAIDTRLLNSSRFLTATGSIYRVHTSSASMTSFLELTA